MSGQKHTTECRRRLEDAMATDTSTAARVKATRVRQAERIVRDLTEACSIFRPGTCGSGPAEMQTGGQEAPVTRKRSAETDAERLEEEVTSAEADSERRFALKRKAEGDPMTPRWRTP